MPDTLFISDSDQLTLTGAQLKSFLSFFATEVSLQVNQETVTNAEEVINNKLRFFISQSVLKMLENGESLFQANLQSPACIT